MERCSTKCSFCGKTADQVKLLLSGAGVKTAKPVVIDIEEVKIEIALETRVAICNECIDECNTAIATEIMNSIAIPPYTS